MIAVAPQSNPVATSELAKQVSASRLGLWSACRLKFYFKYVLGIEKPATPALHLGKVVHSVLQQWNLARWRGQEMNPTILKEVFELRWAEQEDGIQWDNGQDEQLAKGWGMLELYLQQHHIPPDEKPQAVEVRLEADLQRHGLPTLIGILDLVRPPGTIVDYKTSAQTPEITRLIHQTELQLTCYATLYREATGQEEIGFELHHLIKQKVPKVVVTTLSKATDQQQTRLFRQMESYVEGVSREDFVPSPGLQCLSCQYFNECRRWS